MRIADTAAVGDPDGLAACTNISSYDQFKWRMGGGYANSDGVESKGGQYTTKGLKDLLTQYRTFPNSPVLPPENRKDPKKMVLISAVAEFTLQDFFDQYGVLNYQDDTGDYFDTNGNGKVDQIAWIDFNNNGKLDLWAVASAAGGDLNIYKHPLESQAQHDPLPLTLDTAEFKKFFRSISRGSVYWLLYW